MQITLRQIQYFLGAAEAGQFSAAARHAHVTQTAITAAIRELEQTLNVELFERHHASGVSLTADGQRFLEHARSISGAVQAALNDRGTFDRAVRGQVSMIGTPSIYGGYAIPAIARFMDTFKGVRLHLSEASRDETELRVASGEVDLGLVRLDSLQNLVELDAIALTRSRRQIWTCAGHAFLQRRQISLHEVAKEPYVLYDRDDVRKNTSKLWADIGQEPRLIYRFSSLEAVRSMVAHGLAVTILSDVAYRPFSREGLRIDTRPLQESLPPIEIGLIWQRGRELAPSALALKAFFELTFNGPGTGVRVL